MLTALWRGLVSRAPLAEPDGRLAFLLVFGSLPGFIVGLLFDGPIDDFFHRPEAVRTAQVIMAMTLIGMGILLSVAERVGRRVRSIAELHFSDAAIIGIAQALALIPGVSRSGSTLTAGLFLNLRRGDAARFSFLLGIPAIAGAGVLTVGEALAAGDTITMDAVYCAILTFFAGLAAIAFLMALVRRISFLPFVLYRMVLGGFLLFMIYS
jgi:undecaprenyl-diphosphatase